MLKNETIMLIRGLFVSALLRSDSEKLDKMLKRAMDNFDDYIQELEEDRERLEELEE